MKLTDVHKDKIRTLQDYVDLQVKLQMQEEYKRMVGILTNLEDLIECFPDLEDRRLMRKVIGPGITAWRQKYEENIE